MPISLIWDLLIALMKLAPHTKQFFIKKYHRMQAILGYVYHPCDNRFVDWSLLLPATEAGFIVSLPRRVSGYAKSEAKNCVQHFHMILMSHSIFFSIFSRGFHAAVGSVF